MTNVYITCAVSVLVLRRECHQTTRQNALHMVDIYAAWLVVTMFQSNQSISLNVSRHTWLPIVSDHYDRNHLMYASITYRGNACALTNADATSTGLRLPTVFRLC